MHTPTEQDLARLNEEKIKHIEDQINNLDDHIHKLDTFMQSELHRNLPNEYKQTLHSTVSRTKQDASKIRGKAVQAVNALKGKVQAFKQKHNF